VASAAKSDNEPGESKVKDWCDEDGAKRLREKINAYWAERGYEVDVDLVEAGFVPAMRSARTDVRSNMVNGMPRRRAAGEAGSARPTYRPRGEATA
jgi:hypothetical protein